MGKYKPHPRYNVISFRISAAELEILDKLRGNKSRSAIMTEAFEELVKSRTQMGLKQEQSLRTLGR